MARQLYQPAMAFGPHNKVGVAHTISGPNKGAATLIRRPTFSCTELQIHVVRVRERRSPDYACPYNERESVVPEPGLEPGRALRAQGILSPWRLPVPPLRHGSKQNA